MMTKKVKAAFAILFLLLAVAIGIFVTNAGAMRMVDFPAEQEDSFATFSEDVRIADAEVMASPGSSSPASVSVGKDANDLVVSTGEFKEAGDEVTILCTIENDNADYAAGIHVITFSSHPAYLEIIVENAEGTLMPGERRDVYVTCRMFKAPDEPMDFSWSVKLHTEMIPAA